MAVINKWVTGVIALLVGDMNPILWLVGAHRLHVSYPKIQVDPKKRFLLLMEDCNVLTVHHLGCFWTNWVTAAFQKRITSWGSQNKGTTSIFETSILLREKCQFFFDKKRAQVYYCPADFWWVKKETHWKALNPNLVMSPVCVPISRSLTESLTHKRHVFFSWNLSWLVFS